MTSDQDAPITEAWIVENCPVSTVGDQGTTGTIGPLNLTACPDGSAVLRCCQSVRFNPTVGDVRQVLDVFGE